MIRVIDGDDLARRLRRLARLLDEAKTANIIGRRRLAGKAEGVRLALSYVEEALRMQAVPNADR